MSPGQLTVTTQLLLGLCNSTLDWYSPKGPVSPEEMTAMCWRLFLEGVDGIVKNAPQPEGGV